MPHRLRAAALTLDRRLNQVALTTAVRNNAFLNTLGVGTHLEYTDGLYNSSPAAVQKDLKDLQYLGISQVRDGIPEPNGTVPQANYQSALQTFTAAGIKFDLVSDPSQSLATTISALDAVKAMRQGDIIAVEGPNEINNYPVTYDGMANGDPAAQAFQKDLYSAVKADPKLSGVSVYYYTGYGMVDPTPLNPATTPGYADFNNQHPYPLNGQQPASFSSRSSLTNETPPNGAAVYTETGYTTTPGGFFNDGDATVQAKETLNLLFDGASQGISKTYLYQLLDAYAPGSPQGDDGFGLFDYKGAAKPAATAIHNLTSILIDTGSSFTPGSLNYSVTALPSIGNTYLMQKSNGAFDLAVWDEPQIWNSTTKTEITAPTTPMTVVLGQTFGSVKVFDPMQGTSPVQTLSNASSVQVGVTDHPMIVEVSNPSVTPDKLSLILSEDAYLGNANFVAKIDGTQIGSGTVAALHSAGQTQTFTYTGSWGTRLHDLEVDFTNDAYGGSATLDRNLYVKQVTYDATNSMAPNCLLTMDSAGAVHLDHPNIVEVPNSSVTPDKLSLILSEDAYLGNANFVAKINGTQIGSGAVTALHNAGQTQMFTYTGSWGTRLQDLEIDFTNDAYGGSRTLDRNLYVKQVTYDGTNSMAPISLLTMDSAGAVHLAIGHSY
jgi:hypothetical protein